MSREKAASAIRASPPPPPGSTTTGTAIWTCSSATTASWSPRKQPGLPGDSRASASARPTVLPRQLVYPLPQQRGRHFTDVTQQAGCSTARGQGAGRRGLGLRTATAGWTCWSPTTWSRTCSIRNNRNGTFTEMAWRPGSPTHQGKARAGMGIDTGDDRQAPAAESSSSATSRSRRWPCSGTAGEGSFERRAAAAGPASRPACRS